MRKTFVFLLLIPSSIIAAPTISTITGTFTDGGTVIVSGTGYGTKSPAAPYRWAPFNTSSSASSLGQATSWSEIQNMSWTSNSGYGSGGGMQGNPGIGVWTMRVDSSGFNWNDNSSKWHVMRRVKQNYLVTPDSSQSGYPSNTSTDNQKNFRVWPSGASGYSNLYWSIQNNRFYVENPTGAIESGFYSSGANPSTTNWYFEEIICQASSGTGVKDGTLTLRRDGVQVSNGTIISKFANYPAGWVSMYLAQIVIANQGRWSPAWSSSNNAWFDDLYVDNTWQRILVGNASTYANCRKFGVIVPSAWSTTQVTGTLQAHLGDFPAQTTAYAYVFDTSNVPNTAGKAFVIGGSAAGDPAPTVTSINISTGSYLGGTVSTATGTGFTATPKVLVGTQAATGIVMNSATSLRFTIPAHQASDTGLDLKITNPDGQFDVLQATISYDAPAGNNAPYNIDAGDDTTVTLPSGVNFSGSAFDDGLPNPPATLTYLWAKKTGPGTITFTNATAIATFATFSTSGTYTVSMTASDSLLSTESPTVTITVLPLIVTQSTQPVTSNGSYGWKSQ